VSLRHPLPWVCITFLSACGAQHTKLMFTPQNDSGQYWKCTKADSTKRPEHREAKCELIGQEPKEVGNADVGVDMPACDSGVYRSIWILNADSASPTVIVSCGQAQSPPPCSEERTPLDGGQPSSTAALGAPNAP
jgi:hypothetical protein